MSVQMAADRSEKIFPPCETDNPDDLVKTMLEWANGGFEPKGSEGLKPKGGEYPWQEKSVCMSHFLLQFLLFRTSNCDQTWYGHSLAQVLGNAYGRCGCAHEVSQIIILYACFCCSSENGSLNHHVLEVSVLEYYPPVKKQKTNLYKSKVGIEEHYSRGKH